MAEKKIILAVDDELQALRLVEDILMPRGYEVLTTSSGEDALKIAAERRVDVVLLDISMPGMDGISVKARLNEDRLTAAIPVIFLTARVAVDDKVRGFGIGAEDYITKPFEVKELLARIDAVVKRREFYEDIAMTDAVTGLHNTAFFKKEFAIFFNIARRYKQMFSLAIIDIDYMKKINDAYGHAAGDLALKSFASIARTSLRNADIITRYGGDEFTILFPQQDAIQTNVPIERLKDRARKTEILFREKDAKIAFSISAGVAAYQDGFADEMQMFELADARLYEDKKRQRKERTE